MMDDTYTDSLGSDTENLEAFSSRPRKKKKKRRANLDSPAQDQTQERPENPEEGPPVHTVQEANPSALSGPEADDQEQDRPAANNNEVGPSTHPSEHLQSGSANDPPVNSTAADSIGSGSPAPSVGDAQLAVRDDSTDGIAPYSTSDPNYEHAARVPEGSGPEPDLLAVSADDLEEMVDNNSTESSATAPFTVDIGERLKRRLERVIQRSRIETGRTLTITAIVFQGLESNRQNYRSVVEGWRARNGVVQDSALFQQPESRRWAGRATSSTTATITVRPTSAQRSLIDTAVIIGGARTRREFIEAILDNVLPELPGRPPKH